MNRPVPASHFGTDADFDDNPEWTDDDFAAARPAGDILPPHVVAALTEPQTVQVEITLELDSDVIEKFRATGPGWQARINAALRAASV